MIMENKTPWSRVQLARDKERPTSLYYINTIIENFIEMHGDRNFKDDASIIGGIGLLGGHPVTVIAEEKGSTLEERTHRNFGAPHPEGYRKALRLMEQAEKFRRPIICLIDTQGAYCGIGAEERGQGEAIARNLRDMMKLTVPVISVIIGEGGSGGALALGVANRVYMLENALYSILSPEGFAAILWKDSSRAQEAAGVMKITADSIKSLGVIDGIIPEPPEGAQTNRELTAMRIKKQLLSALEDLGTMSGEELKTQRYERFRSL